MRETIRHYINPLHIYCRLTEAGVCKIKARLFCCYYQKFYAIIL